MSIEDIPRWWPGMVLTGGLFGGSNSVHWIRLNDDDPIHPCDIPNPSAKNVANRYIAFQDLILLPDGECWGCMRGGDYKTAHVVKARQI